MDSTSKENLEKRSSARLEYETRISLESLEVGVMHEARMYNYSKNGIYFESDFYLVPGTEVFIGITNSPFSATPGQLECYRSAIKWRRYLDDSRFDYGYGIELKYKADDEEAQAAAEEARRHPRQPCSIPTIMEADRHRIHGMIENASHGGVFIKCDANLSAGQKVFLTIPLKNKQKLITRVGQIMWSAPHGVGIKFQSAS